MEIFIAHVEQTLKEWGVSAEFSPHQQVYTLEEGKGLACSGFFSETPTPRLAVAMGKPDHEWLPILVHEFCHAHQWRERSPLWLNLFDDWGRGREEASDALDRWLEGEEWEQGKLLDVIGRIRDIERDCEERAVEMMKAFGLPINTKEYAQKANSYVYFYNYVAKTRKWYEAGRAPYELPEIWKNAPEEIIKTPETPPQLAEAFERVYRETKPKPF